MAKDFVANSQAAAAQFTGWMKYTIIPDPINSGKWAYRMADGTQAGNFPTADAATVAAKRLAKKLKKKTK